MTDSLIKDLDKLKNSKKAKILSGFFKTGKGEYGEGDIFLGVTVPDQRKIAEKYKDLKLGEVQKLLKSKIHEFRLVASMILVEKYEKINHGDDGKGVMAEIEKSKLVDFYLKNTKYINNWDLVDCSAYFILGDYLFDKEKDVLYNLAKSENLWERRIAIISTLGFIRRNNFTETLKICEILLNDEHDLIHKACGWMLREVGKRDLGVEVRFLKKFYKKMPRTMLRYAIEKFSEAERQKYLKNNV